MDNYGEGVSKVTISKDQFHSIVEEIRGELGNNNNTYDYSFDKLKNQYLTENVELKTQHSSMRSKFDSLTNSHKELTEQFEYMKEKLYQETEARMRLEQDYSSVQGDRHVKGQLESTVRHLNEEISRMKGIHSEQYSQIEEAKI